MPATISPIKKAIVKKSLLEGRSIRSSLKIAGYAPSTVHGDCDKDFPIVKACTEEILNDFKLSEITPEYVLSHVKAILLDPQADYASRLKSAELLGKFLAIWKDRIDVNISKVIDPSLLTDSYMLTQAQAICSSLGYKMVKDEGIIECKGDQKVSEPPPPSEMKV